MLLKLANTLFQSDRNTILVLFLLACIISSAEFWIFDLLSEVNFYTTYTPDQIEYFDAETLLFEEFRGHPTRPVGFPIFLRLIRFLGNGNFVYTYFLAFQFFCWFLTTLAIFKTISLWKNRYYAFSFSLIFLLIGAPASRSLLILTEPLYTLVLVAAIFFLFRYFIYRKDNYLLIFWLLLSFSLTIRTTLFYSSVIVLLLLGGNLLYQKKYLKSGLVVGIFTLFVGFQSFLMRQETGEYKLSYIAEITAYYYYDAYMQAFINTDNKQDRDEYWGRLNKDRRAELCLDAENFSINVLYKKDWASSSESIRKNVKASITAHPFTALKTYLRNFIQNSTGGNDMIFNMINNYPRLTKALWWFTRIHNLILTGTFLLLSLYFVCHLIQNRNLPFNYLTFIPFLIIFNFILTDPITFAQGDRFHVVFYPLVIILIACRKEYIMLFYKNSG